MLKTKQVYNPLKKYITSLENHGFTVENTGVVTVKSVVFKHFSYGEDYIAIGSETKRFIIQLKGCSIVKDGIDFQSVGSAFGGELGLVRLVRYNNEVCINVLVSTQSLIIPFGGVCVRPEIIVASRRLC